MDDLFVGLDIRQRLLGYPRSTGWRGLLGLARRAGIDQPGRPPADPRAYPHRPGSDWWRRSHGGGDPRERGLPVAVVNPVRAGTSPAPLACWPRRTLDARVIPHFAEAIRPAACPPPDAQLQPLGKPVARRRQLVEMLGAECSRPPADPGSGPAALAGRTSPGSSGRCRNSGRTFTRDPLQPRLAGGREPARLRPRRRPDHRPDPDRRAARAVMPRRPDCGPATIDSAPPGIPGKRR